MRYLILMGLEISSVLTISKPITCGNPVFLRKMLLISHNQSVCLIVRQCGCMSGLYKADALKNYLLQINNNLKLLCKKSKKNPKVF
jgi:hypothetical protein